MGVLKRGRRKITVDHRLYVWYVALDDNSDDKLVHVVSEDKRIVLAFPIGQRRKSKAFATVIGREFRGSIRKGRGWVRYRCPESQIVGAVTPRQIAEVIHWATTSTLRLIEVDFRGKLIPLGGKCLGCSYHLAGMLNEKDDRCPKCGRELPVEISNDESPDRAAQ